MVFSDKSMESSRFQSDIIKIRRWLASDTAIHQSPDPDAFAGNEVEFTGGTSNGKHFKQLDQLNKLLKKRLNSRNKPGPSEVSALNNIFCLPGGYIVVFF